LRRPRGRINALPNTDDLACKIQVTDAKRQNLTDAQSKNRSYSQYSAERFRCSGDDFPSFLSEAALLFFDSLTRQPDGNLDVRNAVASERAYSIPPFH